MKTHRIAVASFASAIVLAGALAAWAEQANQNNQSNQSDQNSQNSATSDSRTGRADSNHSIGKLDDKTRGATIRASKLIGQNLKNSNGDSVGEIKDLVIDSSGKVRYAAVTYGGFLGVGSKLFAVPFEAFHVRQNPNDRNDRGDYVMTLDVTKDQLDGAQGFENDRWPDFANTKFTQDLDRRYNVDRSQTNSQADRSQNRNQSR
jgi:sporulation protein YlmC with PRC-barrel domain